MLHAKAGTGMIGCGSYHYIAVQYQATSAGQPLPACGGDILYQITLITVRYYSLVTVTRLNLFGIVH